MGFFEQFPYTNYQDINIDWILQVIKKMHDSLDDGFTQFIEQWIVENYNRLYANAAYDPEGQKITLSNMLEAVGVATGQEVQAFELAGYLYPVKDETARTDIKSVSDRVTLLENATPVPGIDITSRQMSRWAWCFTPYCEKPGYYPQGACLLNDHTAVVTYVYANTNAVILDKIDLDTGKRIMSNEVTAYHANSLSYDAASGNIYSVNFFNTGSSGVSNIVTVIDADTLSIVNTVTFSQITTGIRSASIYNGMFYFVDRSQYPGVWRASMDGSECIKLYTLPAPVGQLGYVTRTGTLVTIGVNGPSMLFYDANTGEYIGAASLPGRSSDGCMVSVEPEGVDQLSDGTLVIFDVGWKTTSTGRFNRHIVTTIGKSVVPAMSNDQLRYDSSNMDIHCSAIYSRFQNGTAAFPYDSLDYAAKVAVPWLSYNVIALDGDFSDQLLSVSNGFFEVFGSGHTIGALSAVNANVLVTSTNINGGAAAVNHNACVYAKAYSKVFVSTRSKVDGASTFVGASYGYGSEIFALGGVFSNCTKKIVAAIAPVRYYGTVVPDTSGSCLVSGYRAEQDSAMIYRTVGGEYGQRTLKPSGITLNNISSVNIGAENVNSPMVAMVIDGFQHLFEFGIVGKVSTLLVKSGKHYSLTMNIGWSSGAGEKSIRFTNVTLTPIDGGGAQKSDFAVTAIKIF